MPGSENTLNNNASHNIREKLEISGRLGLDEISDKLVRLKTAGIYRDLIGGFVHDVNQSLNTIRIICQSLLRDIQNNRLVNEELPSDLTEVVQSVDKLSENIEKFREYGNHQRKFQGQTTDINDIIRELADFFSRQLNNHAISLDLALASDLPQIPIDVLDITHVLVNVIVNATDAVNLSKGNFKYIRIKTEKPPDNSGVIIEISDTGCGVDDTLKHLVFTPFYTTKENGTGLGLFVSRKILAEYAASIEMESTLNNGALFRISLKESIDGQFTETSGY